jgi:hypothetical protein
MPQSGREDSGKSDKKESDKERQGRFAAVAGHFVAAADRMESLRAEPIETHYPILPLEGRGLG